MKKSTLLNICLAIFLINTMIIDFIRRFFLGNKFLLISIDISILLCYFVFFLLIKKGRFFPRLDRLTLLGSLLLAFIAVIFLQLFNQTVYAPNVVVIAGLRAYLMAIPMMAFGSYFANLRDDDFKNVYRFLVFLSVVCIGFAVFQLSTDRTKLIGVGLQLMTPMEHTGHSYGSEIMELNSSFFASSKRFGRFILFIYLVLWGIAKNRKKPTLLLSIFFVSGLIVGGARESLWLFVFFQLFYYLLISKNRIIINLAAGFAGLCGLLLIISGNFDLSESQFGNRLLFLTGFAEDIWVRFVMLVPPLDLNPGNELLLTGIGLGKYGQEALLDSVLPVVTEDMHKIFFFWPDFFSNAINYGDAGLTKITIETGLTGLMIFLFLILAAMVKCWQALKLERDNHLAISMTFWIMAWIIFFLKSHAAISDITLSVFFYMALGYTDTRIRLRRRLTQQ